MSDRPRFALPNPTESILWRRNVQKEGKYAAIVTVRREERQNTIDQSAVMKYVQDCRAQGVAPDYGAVSFSQGYSSGPLDYYKRSEALQSTLHAHTVVGTSAPSSAVPSSQQLKSSLPSIESGGPSAAAAAAATTQSHFNNTAKGRGSTSLAYLVNRRLPNPNESMKAPITRSSEAYGYGVGNAEPQVRRTRPKTML